MFFLTPNHQSTEGLEKGKVFPYSLPSVGPGADPGVQAVSPQARGHLRSFHHMALPVTGSTHLIPAYYSFVDPERMKG